MESYIGWFVVAFGLLVAELLSGTFYLLVISIALAAAGIAALAGASIALQFVVAAAIGIGGSVWLRTTRFGRRLHERLGLRPPRRWLLTVLPRIHEWSPASKTASGRLAALFVEASSCRRVR